MNLSWSELATGFLGQQQYCVGYSPLYEALFGHVARIAAAHAAAEPLEFDEQALIDLLSAAWSDRVLQNTTESSLLLSGAIHAAVLNDDPEAAGISRFFETVGGSYTPEYDHDVLMQMLGGLFLNPSATVRKFLREGRVQTNEVSRGALWLLPAIVLSAWTPGLPITLVDLGCSAGLNLAADAQPWRWLTGSDERTLNTGDPLVTQQLDFERADSAVLDALALGELSRPNVIRRIGLDLNPLYLDQSDDLNMLRACIWGDQAARLARFDRAVNSYRHLDPPPMISAANVIEAVQTLPAQSALEAGLLIVYNTIVTHYFTDSDYAALRANMEDAFRRLPGSVSGLWLEQEAPRQGEAPVPPKQFALKAHTLQNGEWNTRYLAYTDAHPQTVTLLPGWEMLKSQVS